MPDYTNCLRLLCRCAPRNDVHTMNIGIDARMYGHGNGGIGRYIEELVARLILTEKKHTFTFFVKEETVLPVVPYPHKVVRTSIHWYTWQEQLLFPRLLSEHPVDLMHFPHWNIPLTYNKPYVVTIHDLILLHFPSRAGSTLNPLLYTLKHAAYRKVLSHAAHAARHIITVSDYSKKDIVKKLGVSSERITTTYLGVTSSLPQADSLPNTHSHGNDNAYFLYVGVQYPHKNLHFLCNSFMAFAAQSTQNYSLVIAGPKGPCTKNLKHLIHELNTKSDRSSIIFIERPSDFELSTLYAHAIAFVFPSLYEGFGLPPIEAQHAGIPVLASTAASLPEVVGTGALLLSPHDSVAWIDAFSRITHDTTLRASLIEQGHINAARFSWDTLVSSTREVYNNFSA